MEDLDGGLQDFDFEHSLDGRQGMGGGQMLAFDGGPVRTMQRPVPTAASGLGGSVSDGTGAASQHNMNWQQQGQQQHQQQFQQNRGYQGYTGGGPQRMQQGGSMQQGGHQQQPGFQHPHQQYHGNPSRPLPYRKTVCRHWLKGLCVKGNDCSYLHQYDKDNMPLCRWLMTHGACQDPNCQFKHQKDCHMYTQGFCPKGRYCPYYHAKKPAPPPSVEEVFENLVKPRMPPPQNPYHQGHHQGHHHGHQQRTARFFAGGSSHQSQQYQGGEQYHGGEQYQAGEQYQGGEQFQGWQGGADQGAGTAWQGANGGLQQGQWQGQTQGQGMGQDGWQGGAQGGGAAGGSGGGFNQQGAAGGMQGQMGGALGMQQNGMQQGGAAWNVQQQNQGYPQQQQMMQGQFQGQQQQQQFQQGQGALQAGAMQQGATQSMPSLALPPPTGNCRYFIIKCNVEENVRLSAERGAWATTRANERKLNEAFATSEHVVLIFSVNESQHFQGCARMMSRIGDPVSSAEGGGWHHASRMPETVSFGRNFRIRWLKMCELSFFKTKHLRNPYNENLPVKISRDCQEVEPSVGHELTSLLYMEPDAPLLAVARESDRRKQEALRAANDGERASAPGGLKSKPELEVADEVEEIVEEVVEEVEEGDGYNA